MLLANGALQRRDGNCCTRIPDSRYFFFQLKTVFCGSLIGSSLSFVQSALLAVFAVQSAHLGFYYVDTSCRITASSWRTLSVWGTLVCLRMWARS